MSSVRARSWEELDSIHLPTLDVIWMIQAPNPLCAMPMQDYHADVKIKWVKAMTRPKIGLVVGQGFLVFVLIALAEIVVDGHAPEGASFLVKIRLTT